MCSHTSGAVPPAISSDENLFDYPVPSTFLSLPTFVGHISLGVLFPKFLSDSAKAKLDALDRCFYLTLCFFCYSPDLSHCNVVVSLVACLFQKSLRSLGGLDPSS